MKKIDLKAGYRLKVTVTRPWRDLPEDILGLILERLQYVDQIRVRAVCKGWLVRKDLIKCSDWLPWTVNLSDYPSVLKLFDPHSQKTYKVTNPTEKFQGYILPGEQRIVYESKHGWLLLGQEHSSLFLHNPFSNETLFLPILPNSSFLGATFTVNPKSSGGCEVLVFSMPLARSGRHKDCLSINRYRVSSATESWSSQGLGKNKYVLLSNDDTETWSRQILGDYGSHAQVESIHYMNEQLYCFLRKINTPDSFMCYDLADKSWTRLEANLPQVSNSYCKKFHLTGKGKDLITVCTRTYSDDFVAVFKYDWANMCWAEGADINDSTAFFMWNKSIFSSMRDQIISNSNSIEDGCRVFYLTGQYGYK